MKVYVESVLPCPAEKVWNELQRPSVMVEVVRPMVTIEAADGLQFPHRWVEGASVRCKSYLFGFIPCGTRTIFLERIDAGARELQSRENDPLIRRWDHLIRVRPTGNNWTLYSDEIHIEAGWATFFVWMFAQWLYRHRQRKWRQVVRRLVADEDAMVDGSQDRPELDRGTPT